MHKGVKKKKPQRALVLDLEPMERELFLDAYYQGTTFLHEKGDLAEAYAQFDRDNVGGLDLDDREYFLRAVEEGVREAPKKDDKGSLDGRRKKTAKARGVIDAVIDLHGMTTDDAVVTLLKFIEREKRCGSKSLLVIHGKGTGALKNAVWSLVADLEAVNDFQVAPGKFGGHGAMLLRINRKI